MIRFRRIANQLAFRKRHQFKVFLKIVVINLDRLGRNAMDIRKAVELLSEPKNTGALPCAGWGKPYQSGWKDDNAGNLCGC